MEHSSIGGGSAFPQCSYNMKGGYDITGGMTLRDYFAAKAMQAQIGMTETLVAISEKTITINQVCGSCYEWADAMLRARQE